MNSILKIKDPQTENWIQIPTIKGNKGDKGDKGDRGPKGDRGDRGENLFVAKTSSDMINPSYIYLYVGSQSGYTFGDWYYYNGSTWVSGGVYGTGAGIDNTLSVEGKAADAKTVGDTVPRYKEVTPATYDNLLSKIPFPCTFVATDNSAWQDKPLANKTFIFMQVKYSPAFMYQIAYGYGSVDDYYRIVKPSDGTVVYDWRTKKTAIDATLTQSGKAADAKAVGDSLTIINGRLSNVEGTQITDGGRITAIESEILNNVFKYKSINPATYDNLLAKIPFPCSFTATDNSEWIDKPVANKTFIFTQFRYSQAFMYQIAYGYGTVPDYYRIVKPTDGTVIYDWKTKKITIDSTLTQAEQAADAKAVGDRLTLAEGDLANSCFKFITVNPATYDNILAKVPVSGSYYIDGNSTWQDKPLENTGFICTQFRYSSSWVLQIAYQLATFNIYYRIVNPSTGAIAFDWTTKLKNTVYYAIGDSITAGSYSDDEGAHVARNAEWSYPNQIKRMYGIKVTNLGVPGAKITEFPTQAASVQSDATLVTIMGGVNDYGSSTASIGTISDTSESGTIIGALKGMIETIATTAPNARIVLVSPIPQKAGTIDTKWSIGYQRYNFTFEQLYAAFKAVAELYNVELIDGTHNGPVNLFNISTVLKDATHPTKEFYNTLADWMAAHIM